MCTVRDALQLLALLMIVGLCLIAFAPTIEYAWLLGISWFKKKGDKNE